MPRVNTTTAREELSNFRSEFERLSSEGKVTAEVRVLFNGLLVLLELLVSIFLEKTTAKNSKNSSKPSSQTEKDESSSVPGSKSRGKEETDNRFSNSRTKESVQVVAVKACDVCGEDISRIPCSGHERRTKIDIVFEKVIEHIDAEIKSCPNCESEVKGVFPQDMSGPLQYGNGIKAYLINLVVSQMVALNRIQKMATTMIGVTISEHTILKYVMQLYNSLENWENSAKDAMLRTRSMHCDETSLRVSKKNFCPE